MTKRALTLNQAERNEYTAGLRRVREALAEGFELAAREARIHDEELCRMAAFRIREAANRIATLANAAEHPDLRNRLSSACRHLLALERELLELPRAPRASGAVPIPTAPKRSNGTDHTEPE